MEKGLKRFFFLICILLVTTAIFIFLFIKYSQIGYVKEHIIVGSEDGAQTNYQIMLIIHYNSGLDSEENIYCDSRCKGDFGDVRFTDSSGNLLSYWIEEKTDFDRAKIWVKVPFIPAYPETTKIFFHYNNPSSSTTSNGGATFVIFDDFEDGIFNMALWENISMARGEVKETNGVLRLTSPSGSSQNPETGTTAQIMSKVSYTGECSAHVRWRQALFSGRGGAVIVSLLDDITVSPPWKGGYDLDWGSFTFAPDVYNKFLIPERDKDGNILQYTTWDLPFTEAQWLNFELKVLKDSAIVNADGVERMLLQNTDDYTDNETLQLGLHVNSWAGQPQSRITEYDWVFLRKLCDPEPTHSETSLLQKPIDQSIIVMLTLIIIGLIVGLYITIIFFLRKHLGN